MNSLELARKIFDCLSDGYDDEEFREETEIEVAFYSKIGGNMNSIDKDLYIKQLEDENFRLKNSIRSLRNNNKGLMQGVDKLRRSLTEYKKRYGDL